METKKPVDELQQRILRLGQQKLEEEQLYQQIIQAVDRPPANRIVKKTKRRASPRDAVSQPPTPRR
jgi:hypothetical protein